ncbi:4-diphosphocytidyl-2-C-methyl-D-erythritol kinase [Sanguibacter gelidistatuariae]|uniref:4-diphosphocytidyl-2-C-methyl-D-erythritol kinase n=1 Tax=Sanguibacter gelidistatuariae TaxID=1814289 RepID=A0A1G6Q7Z2_9MICO|nr:4-(cytidine 5'-diphospho)-2-C-methyl-D-erythritol kinase [Sanguibacter gelidistatuariae]SDC88448.1 4-diphosphocytidyl-2-C-methyl-D-erythritol kinase [Sanguibacter gelidistatuariae]
MTTLKHLSSVGVSPRSVLVRAPGKVNLSLHVGPVGEDGYHPLVTVFQAVSLYEEVVATVSDTFTLEVLGPGAELVPTDDTNLALRAARALAEHTGVRQGAHLEIIKGVPVAGGMAGGSADAAATLVALDALWGTGLGREELSSVAARLGADVPFALAGHTAVGTGRGDTLTPAMVHGQFHWAFALRSAGLSTPAVFQHFDSVADPGHDMPDGADTELMAALRAGDAERLGRALSNDLEGSALDLAPDLAETMAVARSAGALGVVVSGSGPTVAALGRSRQHALAIAAALTIAGVCESVVCASGPVPGARVVG